MNELLQRRFYLFQRDASVADAVPAFKIIINVHKGGTEAIIVPFRFVQFDALYQFHFFQVFKIGDKMVLAWIGDESSGIKEGGKFFGIPGSRADETEEG